MSSKYNNNKKHGNVFKNWLCPSFLLLPKKSELPKLWGGCSPPRPPGPYAYESAPSEQRTHFIFFFFLCCSRFHELFKSWPSQSRSFTLNQGNLVCCEYTYGGKSGSRPVLKSLNSKNNCKTFTSENGFHLHKKTSRKGAFEIMAETKPSFPAKG